MKTIRAHVNSLAGTLAVLALLCAAAIFYAPSRAQQSGGFPPAKPFVQIICANTGAACNVSALKVGSSAAIWTTTQTSRASTVTLAVDPNLNFSNVPVGTYTFVLSTDMTCAGNNGGIDWSMTFLSGSIAAQGSYVAGSVAAIVPFMQGTSVFGASTAGNCETLTLTGTVHLTVAGTFAMQWAQSSSNVTSTTVPQNIGTFTLTRIN